MNELILIPLFACADRFCGGGLGWRPSFKGRPLYYTAPVLLACLFPFHLDWIGIAFILWRAPGWGIVFKASINPSNMLGWLGLFNRHYFLVSVGCLSAVAVLIVTGHPPSNCGIILLSCVVWAGLSAGIGLAWGTIGRGKDWNAWVEIVRGAMLGLSICMGGLLG